MPRDSRAVIGTDDAAALPGGVGSRGVAFVRRSEDAHPSRVRVALSSAGRHRDGRRPPGRRAATSPALAACAAAARCRWPSLADRAPAGRSCSGWRTIPERQRQDVVAVDPRRDRGMVVVGGPGSGKTGVVRLIAAQHPARSSCRAIRKRPGMRSRRRCRRARSLLLDDVDALLARLSAGACARAADRLEPSRATPR